MTAQQNTWDVRTEGGDLVTDLATLAEALGTDLELAAKTLLASPSHLLAPAELVQEAQEKVFPPKPGGGTPPPISTGTFVSWSGGKGRVDQVVTNGKVSGIEDDVEGTAKSPACRVVVWEKDGDGYKATGKKIGAMAKTLKRIPPLRSGKKSAPTTSATRLVEMIADHEQRIEEQGLGDAARVLGSSVKAVYDRGIAAWPGVLHTGLTREQWGQVRVKAFLDVAAGSPVEGYTRDLGLLAKAHPLNPEHKAIMDVTPTADGIEFVTIDQAEFTDRINALMAPIDPVA